ncbi:MAG TPA: maltotransferase domain-containing protein [Vicinamibacteria bacterium]|nr:maltotransferase domain-containing protein [Vicinamibacteria bacterium]
MARETVESAPSRVVVENVQPEIDAGRHAIKRTVGETVDVTADVYVDGHDVLAAVLRFRPEKDARWRETPMEPLGNDRWRGAFDVTTLEPYRYTVEAWVDAFRTWRRGLQKKVDAGQAEPVDLLVGAELVESAAGRAKEADARALTAQAEALREAAAGVEARAARALDADLLALMDRHPDRSRSGHAPRELAVTVERQRARFGAWYEFFPRSCAAAPGKHGTLRDAAKRLDYVAGMGFDVVYLPPIHPIGRTHRKGKNNKPVAEPGDVGSPWAIGGPEGGHKAVHPDLGTLEDFRYLVGAARDRGLEIAMDLAIQCSPDHPWVGAHPEWFRQRPDGTVQYAENPPKKYEDIFPVDFDTPARQELWHELRDVVMFWIEQGVRIFRVDNPHTKAFSFWEWLIAQVRKDHPETVFLAEAFTRPRVMYGLAKLGFSQSYTYFTWRNTKDELTDYLRELTATPVREFFRPNLWPNTPDILPEPLQIGGRAMFQARLLLAATLGPSYGIYGPAFELMENRPRSPGSEEYLDSEKYQLRHWDLGRADSLKDLITRVNRIRKENPALHDNLGLRFHEIDNPQLLAFSKATRDLSNIVVVVVNLDPHHAHSGWLTLPLGELGLEGSGAYQVHDLVTDARFFWNGPRNYVHIDPASVAGHVFRVRRRVRTERDFDYFM